MGNPLSYGICRESLKKRRNVGLRACFRVLDAKLKSPARNHSRDPRQGIITAHI